MHTGVRDLNLVYVAAGSLKFLPLHISPQWEKFLPRWPVLLYSNVSSWMKQKTGIIWSSSVSDAVLPAKVLVCWILEVFVLGSVFLALLKGAKM